VRLVYHGGCDEANLFRFRPKLRFAALIFCGHHWGLNWGPMQRIVEAREVEPDSLSEPMTGGTK
jgi:hypothetical protein